MYSVREDADADIVRTMIGSSVELLGREHRRVLESIDLNAWAAVPEALQQANRIFVVGKGRSGLAINMAAMHLVHLGLTVHVVGEATTPAIKGGDLLIAVSGSGNTAAVVGAAEIARKVDAGVVAITAVAESRLARQASILLVIPAPEKHDDRGALSSQYAGSLFEQSVLIFMDGLFHTIWQLGGTPARELMKNHSNLDY
jgi:6-phospho-3-hexuloisomerase